mgnify:CR=1 FL=1
MVKLVGGVLVLAYMQARNKLRLKEAIRRDETLSREGILERLFERLFRGLVYAQIWEDPDIDLEALALTPECRVVAIASGGCNVLSYLIADPELITAVDLSHAHVALNRLKLVALNRLPSWQAFHRFFGSADDPDNVVAYDRLIAPHLDTAVAPTGKVAAGPAWGAAASRYLPTTPTGTACSAASSASHISSQDCTV